MGFFRQKKKLSSVGNGTIIPLEQVTDEVFSSKMMGEGYALSQHDGRVYSPVEGTVVGIFPTLHAITLKSRTGESLLVHMGIDTVELGGKPFSIEVVEGQKVTTETLLAVMDLRQLESSQKDATIMVVLPDVKKGSLLKQNELVTINQIVFEF